MTIYENIPQYKWYNAVVFKTALYIYTCITINCYIRRLHFPNKGTCIAINQLQHNEPWTPYKPAVSQGSLPTNVQCALRKKMCNCTPIGFKSTVGDWLLFYTDSSSTSTIKVSSVIMYR